MVNVSHETPAETVVRLRRVLAAATLDALPGQWAFHEHPYDAPPVPSDRMLAMVRDDSSWCVLEPSTGGEAETFGVFAFHFPASP